MKSIVFIVGIVALFSSEVFSQKLSNHEIDSAIHKIQTTEDTNIIVLDANEVYDAAFDGGGFVRLHQVDSQLLLFEAEIGTSFGRVTKQIYYLNDTAIKIVETEENFTWDDSLMAWDFDQGVHLVFMETVYINDWNTGDSDHIKEGKRNVSEGVCGLYEYEPEIEFGLELFHSTLRSRSSKEE